jgi:hypothetical protein
MNVKNMQNFKSRSVWNIWLGIWVLISPFVLGFANMDRALWNNIVVGLLVLFVASAAIGPIYNLILGIWLLISPFVLGFSAPALIWNNVVAGILIGIAASMAMSHHSSTPLTRPEATS